MKYRMDENFNGNGSPGLVAGALVHVLLAAVIVWCGVSLYRMVLEERAERAERAACDRCPMCLGRGYVPKLPEVIQ